MLSLTRSGRSRPRRIEQRHVRRADTWSVQRGRVRAADRSRKAGVEARRHGV